MVEVNFQAHSKVPGRVRKSDRWNGSRKTENRTATLLKTEFGFINSAGQSAQTLGDLLKRQSAERYTIGRVKTQILEQFTSKVHDHILFRHLHFYQSVHDEIALAWMESATQKSFADPAIRRI